MADEREFEWDDDKNKANQRKHKLSFEVAAKVFADPQIVEWYDDGHDEDRWNALGYVDDRLIHVTYALRGFIIRIISARKAERHERARYHESQN